MDRSAMVHTPSPLPRSIWVISNHLLLQATWQRTALWVTFHSFAEGNFCVTKKAERGRIDAFKLWCWGRLLRVPWTARRSNQSIPKEINPEYSLEVLMLKLQYFGHLMQRADSFEKTLIRGKTGVKRRSRQKKRWLDSFTDSMNVNLSKLWKMVEDRGAWHPAVHGVAQLSNWTTTSFV